MKTLITRFALLAFIISLCSCGTHLPTNSTDRKSAFQTVHLDQRQIETIQPITQHNKEENRWPKQTHPSHSNLHSDSHLPSILRDNQNRIRTVGKPTAASQDAGLTLDPNHADNQNKIDERK